VERVGDAAAAAAVIGVGLDVDQRVDELPVPTATSLALEGGVPRQREELLVAALQSLRGWYGRWTAAAGDAERSGLRAAYRDGCLTLGAQVRVEQADGEALEGRAADVDALGRLLVVPPGGSPVVVAAGDVVHLRSG
jgi:BirA family biotin operon repressor/biotin-[acetyl-CoA-carboxylase] ligase